MTQVHKYAHILHRCSICSKWPSDTDTVTTDTNKIYYCKSVMHHKSKEAESRHTSPLHDMSCRLCSWCLFVRSLTKGHLLCHRIMRQKAAGKHLINILSPSDGYTSTGSPTRPPSYSSIQLLVLSFSVWFLLPQTLHL